PAGLREERRDVAGRALRLAVEHHLSASGGCRGEGAPPWRRGRDGELVELQGRPVRGDLVVAGGSDVAELCLSVARELRSVVAAFVEERHHSVHLQVGDKSVPVGDRTPTGPGVKVDAGQPESGWDQDWGEIDSGGVIVHGLAVQEDLGVELAGTPGG